jgi:hypothetical protein
MTLLFLLISQLLSYSILTWLGFIAVAFIAARYLGWPGVILGHIALAAVIFGLDYRWIQSEMAKPGWAGQPDMDAVFFIGVLIRIILINTVLLPISVLAFRPIPSLPQRR